MMAISHLIWAFNLSVVLTNFSKYARNKMCPLPLFYTKLSTVYSDCRDKTTSMKSVQSLFQLYFSKKEGINCKVLYLIGDYYYMLITMFFSS